MKYISFILMLYVLGAYACPTCIGKKADSTAPFFSDEHYQATANQSEPEQSSETSIP